MTPVEETPLTVLPPPEERAELRIKMGLTCKTAAQELGVTARTVWRWEHHNTHLHPGNHRKYQQALKRWRQAIENSQ